jgi:hypothetical protein
VAAAICRVVPCHTGELCSLHDSCHRQTDLEFSPPYSRTQGLSASSSTTYTRRQERQSLERGLGNLKLSSMVTQSVKQAIAKTNKLSLVCSGCLQLPGPSISCCALCSDYHRFDRTFRDAIYASSIAGGGCLFKTTGTALSEAALSAFHNRFQKPSPRGEAQNDLPTLPSSLSPDQSRVLPKNMKPDVV